MTLPRVARLIGPVVAGPQSARDHLVAAMRRRPVTYAGPGPEPGEEPEAQTPPGAAPYRWWALSVVAVLVLALAVLVGAGRPALNRAPSPTETEPVAPATLSPTDPGTVTAGPRPGPTTPPTRPESPTDPGSPGTLSTTPVEPAPASPLSPSVPSEPDTAPPDTAPPETAEPVEPDPVEPVEPDPVEPPSIETPG